jgi:hypothetical protein
VQFLGQERALVFDEPRRHHLAAQALAGGGVADEVGVEDLQRDPGAAHPIFSQPDRRHAPTAQLTDEREPLTEHRAPGQGAQPRTGGTRPELV